MIGGTMHLGTLTNEWNPKMKPYIYTVKKNFYLINLIKTYNHLRINYNFLKKLSLKGGKFLFVGTTINHIHLIQKIAKQCNSFYVTDKWLGGLLTNWETAKISIKRLKTLQKQQKKGFFNSLSKKETATLIKEKEKLNRYLGGVKNMTYLPDAVIIIGQKKEKHALNECTKLGIPSITILDTDCNPSISDLFIPANDDSFLSIKFILTQLKLAINKGRFISYKRKSKNIKKRYIKSKPKKN